MEVSKLNKLIEEKNKGLEREALYSAENIIQQISNYQNQIKILNERIAEARKALTTLEVEQLDASVILGGE